MMAGGTELEDHPLLNDCILRNCFKYLNLKTIGNCRLVSKFWNQAATSYLRQRSYVHFKFAEEIYGFLNVMDSCQDYPYQRFILHIFEHELDHPLVRLLFERFGSTMTSLTLNLQGNSRYAFRDPDPRVFKRILELPHVEEMKLYGLPENILEAGDLFDTSSFPRLKSLSFNIHLDKFGTNINNNNADQAVSGEGPRRALILNILKCAKNLTCLEVGSIRADCARRILSEVDLSRLKVFKTLPFTVASLHLPFCVNMNLRFPILTHLSCFFDLKASSEDLYELLCNLPALEYLRLRGGQGLTNFPIMTRLKEVHLLTLSTLTVTDLAERLPSAHTLNFVLNPNVYNSTDQQRITLASESPVTSVQVTLHDCQHVDSIFMLPLLRDVRRLPYVSRLRLLVNAETLREIFRHFSHLEELHIDDGSVISDEDVTGISADALYSHSNDDQEEMFVRRLGPFIGDLVHLKRLYLGSVHITNASIYHGLAYLSELTSVVIREPLELMAGKTGRLPISCHLFSFYPLALHLHYLVRVEVRESRARQYKDEYPAILVNEIPAIRLLKPHLQIAYVSMETVRADPKIYYY